MKDTEIISKVASGILTTVTVAAIYELALIGTRAVAEDISVLHACGQATRNGDGKKVRKILRGY